MNAEKDKKIKDFFANDKIVSDKANIIFDNFILPIKSESKIDNKEFTNKQSIKKVQEQKTDNIVNFEAKKEKGKIYKFRKIMTIAASLVVVFIGSNAYARTMGYENIFFMIKDLTVAKTENNSDEIFLDKDIIISYKYFNISDNVQMQINELQVKDNKAKLYLLVKETAENDETPFYYKVYNNQNDIMYNKKSMKDLNEEIYTEILELSNYNDDIENLKLEVYSKNKELLKTVSIDLEEKIIEARTENSAVQKISQIDLNKFLKYETENFYKQKEFKDKEVIILDIYDIYYSDSKYIVKYLYMMPSEEEFKDDKVEDTDIYLNTVEFKVSKDKFKLLEIDDPEIFE